MKRNDLFELHHVVVPQQRAGPLWLAALRFVVVVLVLHVRLVVVGVMTSFGLQLGLTVQLLFLPPLPELLLEVMLCL